MGHLITEVQILTELFQRAETKRLLKKKERKKENKTGKKKRKERKKKKPRWWSGIELLSFNRLGQNCSLQHPFWIVLPLQFFPVPVLELVSGGTDFSLGEGSTSPFTVSLAVCLGQPAVSLGELGSRRLLYSRLTCGHTQLSLPGVGGWGWEGDGVLCAQLKP